MSQALFQVMEIQYIKKTQKYLPVNLAFKERARQQKYALISS